VTVEDYEKFRANYRWWNPFSWRFPPRVKFGLTLMWIMINFINLVALIYVPGGVGTDIFWITVSAVLGLACYAMPALHLPIETDRDLHERID
jgi:hypothetical protein